MPVQAATLDLGDRKELYFLVDRLSPRGRVLFLLWCVQNIQSLQKGPEQQTLQPTIQRGHSGSTWETYQDLLYLDMVYGMDIDKCRRALEWVQRKRKLPEAVGEL